MIQPIRRFVQVEEPESSGLYSKGCHSVKVLSVSIGIEDIKQGDVIIVRETGIECSGKYYFVDYDDIFAIDK